MTDTKFYDGMASLATELMNSFGTPATLQLVTRGKPDSDGNVTKTTQDFPGLAVRIQDQETIQALGLQGELAYCVKFTAEPTGDHVLVHQGTWQINKVKLVNPEGNRLMLAFLEVTPA